jgi:hypothetical protein
MEHCELGLEDTFETVWGASAQRVHPVLDRSSRYLQLAYTPMINAKVFLHSKAHDPWRS